MSLAEPVAAETAPSADDANIRMMSSSSSSSPDIQHPASAAFSSAADTADDVLYQLPTVRTTAHC